MATLYKQQIYCLHGQAGLVTADVAADAASIPVDGDVIADPTVAAGAQVYLRVPGTVGDYNGALDSALMVVTAVDAGAGTVAVDRPPLKAFDIGAHFHRAEHVAFKWTEDPALLTQCPENPAHPVRAGSSFVADQYTPETVTIKQNASGNTRPLATPVEFDVAPGQDAVVDVSWPFAVTLSYIRIFVITPHAGDWATLEVFPDSPSGYPTAAVAVGATTFPVTPAMAANKSVRPGMRIKLMQPGGSTDDLGRLIAVDRVANTITVETATVHAFTVAAVILLTYTPAYQIPIPNMQTEFTVGEDAIQGSEIPANKTLRLTYHNGGGLGDSKMLIYLNYWT